MKTKQTGKALTPIHIGNSCQVESIAKSETERLSVELPSLIAGMVRLAAHYNGGDLEAWMRRAVLSDLEADMDNILHDLEKFVDGQSVPSEGGAK